jgi:sporulation protein YlmC with PRC-barrel domain
VPEVAATGRHLWAALQLLDRPLVDREGTSIGRVDDLELELPTEHGALPVVAEVLCGQAALARRFHPRLGRALEWARRVQDPVADPGPARIPADRIISLGTEVRVALDRDEAPTTSIEHWLVREVLRHVPGSGVGAEAEEHDAPE